MKRFFIPTLLNNPNTLFSDFDSFYRAYLNATSSRADASNSSNASNSSRHSILPNYRVHEDDKAYSLEIDLAGVNEKDIDISIKDNVLTVSATRKRLIKAEKSEDVENTESRENAENSENSELVESVVAKYERSFSIGNKIDTDNIDAICRDGVLLLSLPISEEKVSIKKIEVNKQLESSEDK